MKILKLQYILILAVLPACQDENFQVPMEENEVISQRKMRFS